MKPTTEEEARMRKAAKEMRSREPFANQLSIDNKKRRDYTPQRTIAAEHGFEDWIAMRVAEQVPISSLDANMLFAVALAPFTMGDFGTTHTITRENPFE